MEPLQYDLRCPVDAATTMWFTKTGLQNTMELRATPSKIAAPKPDLDFEALFKRSLKRKITSAKIEKICWQISIAALMQPLQYDLRCPAAKDNSITHTPAAPRNIDAATTMRSAETDLQNTKELRARTFAKRHLNCQLHYAADPSMIPVETNMLRNRPPDKLPHTSSEARFKTHHFVHLLSLTNAFRARLPSKSESGRYENEAVVRDFPQNPPKMKMEDMKTKL